MTLPVLLLVLGAALLNASWNAMVKSVDDRLTALALVNLGCALLAAPFALALPLPAPESWPYLVFSVAANHLYFAALMLAFRHGDLSFVYPLARGVSPLLIAAAAWLLLDETLSPLATGGLLLISGAILSLAFLGRAQVRAIGWALANGLSIAGYTLSDGVGARLSGEPFAYAAWICLLNGPPLALLALWLRGGPGLLEAARGVWRRSLAGAALFVVNFGIVIWALSVAPIAYVSAIRETSVLFAALIGARLLAEPFGGRRIAAAAGVCVGAALLQLGRAA